MAYNNSELFEKAKKIAKSKKLIFVEEIVGWLPCSKPTFYDHFPPESNEFNELKEILENNRIEMKSGMRTKWYKSDNATLQVALMKLISNEDEAARLNGSNQKIDHTTKGEKLPVPVTRPIVISVEGIPKSLLERS